MPAPSRAVRAPRDAAGRGAWPREPGTEVRRFTAATADPSGGDPEPRAIRSGVEVARAPIEWEPHVHTQHELLWVHGGSMTARVGDRIFTLSEGRGLWIPAGVLHTGRLTAHGRLFDAFFEPARTPALPGAARGAAVEIAMTPVLESLLTHLARPDLDAAARARAEAVVFDVIEPAAHPFALAVPEDARIAPIVRALLDDPADARGLDHWAAELGTSDRTIARVFRRATGLSFAQWRQALRVHRALSLLGDGHDVQTTAELLGYAQPSTFIAAFRRTLGRTPGADAGRASGA